MPTGEQALYMTITCGLPIALQTSCLGRQSNDCFFEGFFNQPIVQAALYRGRVAEIRKVQGIDWGQVSLVSRARDTPLKVFS